MRYDSNLAHGTISRESQIAYWYCVSRQLETFDKPSSIEMFCQDVFLDDALVDLELCIQYKNDFRNLFRQKFNEEVPINMHIHSRYQCGLLLYRSLAYSMRHFSASHRVSVQNNEYSFALVSGMLFSFSNLKNRNSSSLNECYA